MGWIQSDASGIRTAESFSHTKLAQGRCPACERDFVVMFCKSEPNTVFSPVNFTCSCGSFIYDPEQETTSLENTGLTPEQLRDEADRRAVQILYIPLPQA